MLQRSLIVLDTETSGLRPEDGCEVIQICAKALNYWDFSDHPAGKFHAYLKPQRPDKAQAGALRVIGEGWTTAQTKGLEHKVVWRNFHNWVSSVNDGKSFRTAPIVVAYNARFDMNFIEYHMNEHKLLKEGKFGPEYPWGFVFDAMGVAYMLLESHPDITDLKLNTILNMFNIKRQSADVHTADEDVDLLCEWLVRAMNFCRKCRKQMVIK